MNSSDHENPYSSLIASHLQYCTLLWASSHVTHIRKLKLLQKKAIRIITSSHYIAHIDYSSVNVNDVLDALKDIKLGKHDGKYCLISDYVSIVAEDF